MGVFLKKKIFTFHTLTSMGVWLVKAGDFQAGVVGSSPTLSVVLLKRWYKFKIFFSTFHTVLTVTARLTNWSPCFSCRSLHNSVESLSISISLLGSSISFSLRLFLKKEISWTTHTPSWILKWWLHGYMDNILMYNHFYDHEYYDAWFTLEPNFTACTVFNISRAELIVISSVKYWGKVWEKFLPKHFIPRWLGSI